MLVCICASLVNIHNSQPKSHGLLLHKLRVVFQAHNLANIYKQGETVTMLRFTFHCFSALIQHLLNARRHFACETQGWSFHPLKEIEPQLVGGHSFPTLWHINSQFLLLCITVLMPQPLCRNVHSIDILMHVMLLL